MSTCTWSYREFEDAWFTSCNNVHQLMCGTPKDNHYVFCSYCGKRIIVSEAPADVELKMSEYKPSEISTWTFSSSQGKLVVVVYDDGMVSLIAEGEISLPSVKAESLAKFILLSLKL